MTTQHQPKKRRKSVSCTPLQLRVLWLHYFNEPLPDNTRYDALLFQMLEKVGYPKLSQAIALVPNDPNLPDKSLIRDLPVLDAFYAHPTYFQLLPKSALNWEPERLYQDGESAIVWISNKLYRYSVDDVFFS